MSLPLFFRENIGDGNGSLILDEDSSRHIVQVLRMKENEALQLTDGIGNIYTVIIESADKKKCEVHITSTTVAKPHRKKTAIAISLLKNSNRFEWFLEKATEIGVAEIIPLICARTERQHLRYERMKNILVSAILQSRQAWLPVLSEPIMFSNFMKPGTEGMNQYNYRFVAHCGEEEKKPLSGIEISEFSRSIILIGPEGDFTQDEIKMALDEGFTPVSLGDTRLRTETAGMVAAVLMTGF